MNMQAAQRLIDEGAYVEAAELINQLAKESHSFEENIQSNLMLTRIKMDNGLYSEAEALTESILNENPNIYQRYYASILNIESRSTRIEVDKIIIELISLLREIRKLDIPERDFLIFHTLNLIVFNSCDAGNFDDVNKYLDEMDIIASKLDMPLLKLIAWHQRARMHDFKGELYDCEKNYALVINYKEGKHYAYQYSKSLHNIANIYYYKGEYQKAIEAFDFEIQLHEITKNEYYKVIAQTDKAWCLYANGDALRAVTTYANAYNFIKGKKDLDYKIRTEVLSRLIMILTGSGNLEKAKDLLVELEELVNLNLAEKIKRYYDISHATILKTSKQSRNRAKAIELFQKIAYDQLFDIEFTVYSFISLAELLIFDFLISREEELIAEINSIIIKLYQLADKQNSISIQSQTDWLAAKISLLKEDQEKAKKLLIRAMHGAERLGYLNLAHRISNELDELEYSFEADHDLIQRNMLSSDLAEIILFNKQTVGQDESIMFFMMADSGLPLYSKTFLDEIELDENLISTFIHAINSFGSEALQTVNSIKRIQYQEFIILIELMNDIHFVYVMRGKSYPGMKKLNQFINDFQETELLWDINHDAIYLEEDQIRVIDELVKKIFQ